MATYYITSSDTLASVNAASFSSGDRVLFRKGDEWRGELIVSWEGVTIGNYGDGALPIINGSSVATTWTLDAGAIYKKTFATTPRILIDNGVHPTRKLWNTDRATTFSGATAGCYSIDEATKTAYVWCLSDADANTHTIQVAASTDEDCILVTKSGVRIDGLAAKYATINGIKVIPAAAYTMTDVLIKNCDVSYCGRRGMRIYNENNVGGTYTATAMNAYNNTVSYCMTYGIDYEDNVHDCTASYNVVSYCGLLQSALETTGAMGIYAGGTDGVGTNNPDNIIFEHNLVHHQFGNEAATVYPEGAQIQFDDYTTNCIMRYNTVRDGCRHGLTDNDTNGGNQIYCNIIYGNGTVSDGGASINSSIGTTFYNNTLYNNAGYGLQTSGGARMTNVLVKNNIFMDNGSNECYFYGTTNSKITSDYNCVYHTAGGTFMDLNITSYNWADWKTNSGQDAHSINVSPSFINAGSADFRLSNSSSAIAAGTDVSLTTDYAGRKVPFPSGNPDIGANERVFPTGSSSHKMTMRMGL